VKILFSCSIVLLLCTCALEGYNVIGPAGGFIFYDKGHYSDGWRYLEASPVDAGQAAWGDVQVETSVAIGSGKQNTGLILAALAANGESGKAAQLCAEFSYGGYTDWFLPSRNEFHLLFKVDELDNYHHKWRWTSSGYTSSNGYRVYAGNPSTGGLPSTDICFIRPIRRF